MNNILKANQIKLRFNTNKGMLNVEQLFDISLADLSLAIKSSHKLLGEASLGDDLSFLESVAVSAANQAEQLRFDVMKEIYQLRKSELEAVREAREIKEHNAKIDALIAQKQNQELEEMSIEELMKLRK